jgi:hypothetical protein
MTYRELGNRLRRLVREVESDGCVVFGPHRSRFGNLGVAQELCRSMYLVGKFAFTTDSARGLATTSPDFFRKAMKLREYVIGGRCVT